MERACQLSRADIKRRERSVSGCARAVLRSRADVEPIGVFRRSSPTRTEEENPAMAEFRSGSPTRGARDCRTEGSCGSFGHPTRPLGPRNEKPESRRGRRSSLISC